jgi:hypothetical protein
MTIERKTRASRSTRRQSTRSSRNQQSIVVASFVVRRCRGNKSCETGFFFLFPASRNSVLWRLISPSKLFLPARPDSPGPSISSSSPADATDISCRSREARTKKDGGNHLSIARCRVSISPTSIGPPLTDFGFERCDIAMGDMASFADSSPLNWYYEADITALRLGRIRFA